MLVRLASPDGGAITEHQHGALEFPLDATSRAGPELPCRSDEADLWFAEGAAELERAKSLCAPCPIRAACLAGALERAEPWGVWGGQIFERGTVIPRKRNRGRPSRADLARDRACAVSAAPLAGRHGGSAEPTTTTTSLALKGAP